MTLVQTEPKSIKIGPNLADMQGPCPTGFHVPSSDELTLIVNAFTGWNLDGTYIRSYLKIPYSGYLLWNTGQIDHLSDERVSIWSSTSTSANYGKTLQFSNGGYLSVEGVYKAYGYPIRPFKNISVTPDNTWTTIYGTLSSGIFHNSTLGLISLSSDGTNWITMSDKNLGATVVYNVGDTLSEANCGKFYQWGNNYGFPYTGAVTTSSTQVDASNYGPGNYYSSSTFITQVPRDNPINYDLRGGVSGATKEIKRVTMRPGGVEKQIRPAYRIFTITWTETSSPSSFNPVYSDDATGLTTGSTAFDEFFGYSAVRLSTAGVETAEITQAQSGGNGKLDITQLGTLTSGDNVMIKFPVRGIKMTKNGSAVTLSITDGIGRESEGYQYYSFQNTGDIEANANNTVATKPLYIGAYLAYNNSSTLKSWSGQTPSYYNLGNAITYAGNNGTGYTIMGYYQRQYISALYMMKYGNPDGQTQIGRGYVRASNYASTGGTNSQTNASYGTTSNTTQMKLFGLEDYRGNKYQWIGGLFLDSSKNAYTALHTFTTSTSTSQTQYKNTGSAIPGNGELKEIVGNNKAMFLPLSQVSNSSYNTYYCDNTISAANRFAVVGGDKGNGSQCGAFNIYADNAASNSGDYLATRIMYL